MSRRLHILLLVMVFAQACGGGGSQNFATCGNGQLDTGEGCDDGNLNDRDACTTACQPAVCGDGVAFAGVEECDGPDLNEGTCAPLGLGGRPSCDSACQYDFSTCGAQFTSTFTPAPPTPTPTATPTPMASTCGDGLLSPDETCDSCAADCTPQTCSANGATTDVTVSLALPAGQQATRIALSVAYRTNVVTLPSTARDRVFSLSNPPLLLRATDTDYRVDILTQSSAIASGPFAGVRFDRCAGAAAPTAADFACTVTTCLSGTTALSDCTCTARP